MRSQDSSPGIPARWMTASAPWQAAVMASMSVTDAWMASSPGPAVSGATSSTRSVRPGPGQPRPQHGPDEARGPGDDDDGHGSASSPSRPGYGRVPGHVRTLFISQAGSEARNLMGLTRGSLTLPRMNAWLQVLLADESTG